MGISLLSMSPKQNNPTVQAALTVHMRRTCCNIMWQSLLSNPVAEMQAAIKAVHSIYVLPLREALRIVEEKLNNCFHVCRNNGDPIDLATRIAANQ